MSTTPGSEVKGSEGAANKSHILAKKKKSLSLEFPEAKKSERKKNVS
jgi:hypothetical protein